MVENKQQYKTAIFLMGGGLINDAGIWRTTNYDEGDKFGVIGDRAIVVAASLLFKEKDNQLLVALGGRGQYENNLSTPCVAEVIKSELIGLGVSAGNILEEKESGSTYQQLLQIQTIWRNKNFDDGQLFSNRHGLPRILAMIEYREELVELKEALADGSLAVVSAEDVLVDHQPEVWRPIIKKAYDSELMKKRIVLEERGTRQVKNGTYKFK